MKNVSLINGNYFVQAVGEMAKSDLFPVKIQLGPELKDSTLKVFMDQVEAVPVEKEDGIDSKIIEMYNFIFDDEYQIPEGIFEEAEMEEVTMEEVTMEEGIVGEEVKAPVEKPVKEKKAKEPKVPKEKKERKAPATSIEKGEWGFRKGSKCELFIIAVKENPGITMKEIRELTWNDNKATYNGTLSKMKGVGKMRVEKGQIYLV